MVSETSLVTEWVTGHPYLVLLISTVLWLMMLAGLWLASKEDR